MAASRLLITAGPTHEDLDPVRFLGNRSSGRMGYAIADQELTPGSNNRVVLLSDGVANLGTRPAVGGEGFLVEAHLFDFDGDIYGATVRVSFIGHIRAERKFDGLDALKAQIAADCDLARDLLGV